MNKPLTPEAVLSKWDVITNFGMSYRFLLLPILIMEIQTMAEQRTLHPRKMLLSK